MIELTDFPDHQTINTFKNRFTEMDPNALKSWLNLLKKARELEENLNTFLNEKGLQQSRFFSLILLARNPSGLKISALAKGIGVSKPTMSGLIDRMERDGLIIRTFPIESRRECLILLSDKGDKILSETLPEHYKRISEIFNAFSDKDHENLNNVLSKINIEGVNPDEKN